MFCPRASCGSASSASSQQGGVESCCRFVSSCSKTTQQTAPSLHRSRRLEPQPLGPVPAVALRWSWSSDSTPGNSRKPSEVTLTRLDSTPPSNRPACHPTRTPGVRPPLGSERRTRRNLRQTALWRASATAGKAALQLVRRSCQLQTPAMRPRNTTNPIAWTQLHASAPPAASFKRPYPKQPGDQPPTPHSGTHLAGFLQIRS